MVLNSNNISSQLVITGNATNRSVSFSGLLANQSYEMQITVSNAAGVASTSGHFYTTDGALTLFDSGGFSDDTLYPLGPLQAMTNAGAIWAPATEPAEVFDSGEAPYGKVLRRMQMGVDQVDWLQFPPVASGVLRRWRWMSVSPTLRCGRWIYALRPRAQRQRWPVFSPSARMPRE